MSTMNKDVASITLHTHRLNRGEAEAVRVAAGVRDGHAEAVIVSVAVVVRVDDVEAELVRVAVALRDGIAAISAPKEVARHARIIIQRHDARTRNILKIIVDETRRGPVRGKPDNQPEVIIEFQ